MHPCTTRRAGPGRGARTLQDEAEEAANQCKYAGDVPLQSLFLAEPGRSSTVSAYVASRQGAQSSYVLPFEMRTTMLLTSIPELFTGPS